MGALHRLLFIGGYGSKIVPALGFSQLHLPCLYIISLTPSPFLQSTNAEDIPAHRNRNILFIALSILRVQHLLYQSLRRAEQGQEAQIPTVMCQVSWSSSIPAFLGIIRVYHTPHMKVHRCFAKTNVANVYTGVHDPSVLLIGLLPNGELTQS